jgi:hypothetical protein
MLTLLEDFQISTTQEKHMILEVFDDVVQNYAAIRSDSVLEVAHVSNVYRLR